MKPGEQSISNIDISVVIPLLNEERNLERLSHSLVDVLDKEGKSFEIIYIDDGSTDKTLQLLRDLHNKYNFIKIIKLAKNFGQQKAASAGIKYARGRVIITMDGDLQYNPEEIPKFLKKIDEGYDAVIGYRKVREGGLLKRRLPSRIANIIISFLSGVRLKDFGCPFRAFKRNLKENIENYGEAGEGSSAFFVFWRASKIAEIEIDNSKRQLGRTSYRFSSLLMLLLDFIIIFSIRPLQISLLILMGSISIFLSGLLLLSCLFRFLPINTMYLILSVLLLFTGIELITLGIINERISRITNRVQQRPHYIIEEIIE